VKDQIVASLEVNFLDIKWDF